MTKYYADSQGNYDIQAVMRDVRSGVKRIEIDFSEFAPKLLKELRGQEDYYKK
jgi:hypothetical protein